jgi:hypothetical protein
MIDKAEALEVLRREMTGWRGRSYRELASLVGAEKHSFETSGPSNTVYYVTVEALWDNEPKGNVRVLGCVDDGGWRAFVPLSDSFIVAPDGTFVGE